MKTTLLNISKAMAFATAIGAASVAWAQQVTGVFPASTDFESNTDYVVLDSTASNVSPRPESHGTFTASPSKVLDLEEADDPIVKSFGTSLSGSVYFDALLKLAPATTTPEVSGATDKLLVYTKIFTEPTTTTNLCVWAKDAQGTAQEFQLTNTIDKATWYRVVIAVNNGEYQVFLNDNYPSTPCATAGGTSTFYALSDGALSEVALAGSGRVDDLVLSDVAPDKKLMTLSWDTSLTASYTVAGGEPIALSGTSPQTNAVAPGAAVVLTVSNSDGASKVYTGTAGTDLAIGSASATFGWADYLGAAVDGAYTIDDAADLNMLRKGVAAGLSTTGETFKQTDDIDMASAGAFAGIGVYSDNPTAGTPFAGSYDGQGYKISNITMTVRKYGGIFNQVNGGTIKNLTVENISVPADASGEYGYGIVGNAGNGATLTNLVAEGSFGSAEKPGTHNMAGIAIRLSGGGAGTLVKDCTNNAAIYGNYTKLAGISALTQYKVTGGAVTFDGCANNGDLYLSRSTTGVTGFAGIVGYVEEETILVNCSNTGSLNNTVSGANTDKNGALVGWAYSKDLIDNGGNSAAAADKMIGTQTAGKTPQSITGFKYATIANGVATTVLPPLAAGATYLLEGNVAASATPVATLTAVGNSIAFDKSLGYTFAGTVGNSGAAGIPQVTEVGNVVTYTAGYFPRTATAGQDGTAANPYEIADVDDLAAFKAYVDNGAGRSLSYKLTADIDASSLCPWTGIGTFVKAPTLTSFPTGKGFDGVLDGNGKTISNVTFAKDKTYGGFFNTLDGTVRNLTINVAGFEDKTGDEVGYAAFAGMAFRATFENCVATGTIGTTEKPATHTCGGFAVKSVNPVFVNCTNYVNIVNSLTDNPKVGGFVGLCEGAFLTNCWNSGDITITLKKCKADANGAGGMIGYAQARAVTIHNCGNDGTIQSTNTTADGGSYDVHVGTIVGSVMSSGSMTVSGGTVAQADAASAGLRAGVTGADFATVDGNVATFVADNALAAGNTYKVMASGVTATYAFTAPGTIAFDTALATPTYAITAAQGLTVTSATEGTVTTYKAVVPAAIWIAENGNWNDAANWDIGFVPTRDTVVTFTNNAEVAISGSDACKAMVLDNATVTLGRASGVDQPILNFYGDGNSAVSVASGATGSLAVSGISLFNQRKSDTDLTIGCDLEVLDSITFRGVSIISNSKSASFAITGKTTVSANAKVRTLDWANTKFQGGIEVSPGVVAKISTQPNGKATIGNGITLVANDNAGDHAAVWLMQYKANSGGVEFTGGASIAVDANHAATCYVKTTSSGGLVDDVWCDVYELYRKRTVKTVTVAEGLAVTGVTTGQRVAPGEELSIVVSGVAEGYEPSVTITKSSDSSVLLTTNAVSFAYTMPDFDIDVSVTANEVVAQLPAWATDVTGDPTAIDPAVSEKYADWAKDIAGSSAYLTQDCSAQFLMNVPVAAEVALTIDGIEVTSDGTIVTIGATQTISGTTEAIALGTTDAGVDTPAINGILNVVVADSISGLSSTTAKKAIPAANLVFVNGKAQVLIPAGDGRFVKASVDYSKPSSSITAVTE